MAERPILFQAEMVRAILEGRKTQTRRVVKSNDAVKSSDSAEFISKQGLAYFYKNGQKLSTEKSPYGVIGDELYVKETGKTREKLDSLSPSVIAERAKEVGYKNGPFCPLFYLADDRWRKWSDDEQVDFGDWGRTRASIHMPRWASRIKLKITDIRVERLQDISEEDAIAEGIESVSSPDGWADYMSNVNSWGNPQISYLSLWEKINGYESTLSNPWVWVIKFKEVQHG